MSLTRQPNTPNFIKKKFPKTTSIHSVCYAVFSGPAPATASVMLCLLVRHRPRLLLCCVYWSWLSPVDGCAWCACATDGIQFLTADGLTFAHPLQHLGKSKKDLPLIAIDSFRHMYVFPDIKVSLRREQFSNRLRLRGEELPFRPPGGMFATVWHVWHRHGIYSLHGMDRSLDSIATCVTKKQRGFSPISEERSFF